MSSIALICRIYGVMQMEIVPEKEWQRPCCNQEGRVQPDMDNRNTVCEHTISKRNGFRMCVCVCVCFNYKKSQIARLSRK